MIDMFSPGVLRVEEVSDEYTSEVPCYLIAVGVLRHVHEVCT